METRKQELRQFIREKLGAMNSHQVANASDQIAGQLRILINSLVPEMDEEKEVGVFSPLPKEPNLLKAFKNYKALSFPYLLKSEEPRMIFKKSSENELQPKKFKGFTLNSPSDDAPEVKPEILFIPGIAFSLEGKRLGRGKAFYDRYLAKNPTVKIGVCFHSQVIEDIPNDEHDQVMDYILTEKGIWKEGQKI